VTSQLQLWKKISGAPSYIISGITGNPVWTWATLCIFPKLAGQLPQMTENSKCWAKVNWQLWGSICFEVSDCINHGLHSEQIKSCFHITLIITKTLFTPNNNYRTIVYFTYTFCCMMVFLMKRYLKNLEITKKGFYDYIQFFKCLLLFLVNH
jgi:hypothetical protein